MPGQLGEVGAWLHEAESVLSKQPIASEDSEEMADAVKLRLDEHRSVFKKMNIMNQFFSKFKRSSKFSGQSVPQEQLKAIADKFQGKILSLLKNIVLIIRARIQWLYFVKDLVSL